MGLINKILSFVRVTRNGANISDVKVDPGGGPVITAEHFAPAGDDAHPLTTDYALTTPVSGTGRAASVGYLDPLNTPKAQPGEKRVYARDASSGAIVVELWLKNDSTAVLENENGTVTLAPDGSVTAENANGSTVLGADGSVTLQSPVGTFLVAADGTLVGSNGGGAFQLQPGGDFAVNGAVISAAGEITNAAGIVLGTHTHPQGPDSGGNTEQNTGGPA